jgi:alpha-glucuronidase
MDERQSPAVAIRWVNEWNNLDGTIERGYGGPSIFWENGRARADLGRAADYARMLASLGISGCAINNVNADPRFLTSERIADVARVAGAFRPWGVRIALAVDFGSPKSIGGLETFDPLDASVAAWWKSKVDEIYRVIPDLAGFVLKAEHADAANVVARALKPHAGVIFYRGFVYDHHMDWRNPKNDRARAAYDNFHELDGKFDDNVIIQIKNGPIDFQVREPASPLFGGLDGTRKAIELQITQEYFGQARHTVFLAPMWKETLDFDMRVENRSTPVKKVVNDCCRSIERRNGCELVRQSHVTGESLRFRPAGMERGPDVKTDCGRMDAPDVRLGSARGANHHGDATQFVAYV